MRFVFAALFTMPLWLLLLIALLLGGLGFQMQTSARAHEQSKAALLAKPLAAAVPISAFDATPDGALVVEAHVIARWAPEYNTQLFTTSKSGKDQADGSLVVLMSEAAGAKGAREVAAVIIVPPQKHEQTVAWLIAHMQDFSAEHALLQIDGLVSAASQAKHVDSVLKKHGLRRAPGFFYFAPSLDGRDAALKADPAAVAEAPLPAWYSGLFLTAIAALRFVFRKLRPAPVQPLALRAARFAKPATTGKTFVKPNRSGKMLLGLGLAGLAIYSGLASLIVPFAVLGLAYYGFFTLKRQVTTSTIRRMDRLTGVAEPHSPPPQTPSPVGLRTNLNLPKSGHSDSPIVSTPSLSTSVFNLLKSRSIMAGLSFVAAIGMFVGTAYLSGGEAGVKRLADGIMAPLTGASITQMAPAPEGVDIASQSLGPAEISGAKADVGAAYSSALRNIALTVMAALGFGYARRWLNRRYGLALNDPWEKLDARLH